MEKSIFQFSDPRIAESEFYINSEFESEKFSGFNMVSNIQNRVNEDKTEAIVSLEVVFGERNENYPFYLRVVNLAQFRCDDSNMFDKLIKTNAPALLLSYIRPYVTMITSQAGLKPFHIPFMNFANQEEQQETFL